MIAPLQLGRGHRARTCAFVTVDQGVGDYLTVPVSLMSGRFRSVSLLTCESSAKTMHNATQPLASLHMRAARVGSPSILLHSADKLLSGQAYKRSLRCAR